ncbi:MAG: hypothetical protein INQ03_15355 [Candidatus Heimdallarchaeota archaeon]|nr:hypothetical protein [Candidatus Heimdallarchaeota archaeon]
MKASSPYRYYFILFICFEKFIQHIYVTYAFAADIDTIRSDVVLDYRILMYSGFFVAWVFLISGYTIFKERAWGLTLLWFLGWFDFLGEHIAQGGSLKFTPVSYIVAIIIIIIVPLHRRGMKKSVEMTDVEEKLV